MFERILVGVDFRASGRDAIALASRLLGADGSITLVHVHSGGLSRADALDPTLAAEDRVRAEQHLEQERDEAGVRAELVLAEGLAPGRVLHEQAEARGADLLVLGSCHRGVFGRVMLGNDTVASLNGAPCAVAIAPHGYAEHAKPLAVIGVAYDSSQESKAAIEAARQLAEPTRARIRALHIITLSGYQYTAVAGVAIARIDDLVHEAEEELRSLDGVDGHAEYGLPREDLAAFGKQVDLLVAGSRGYGPWGRLVHGSTSNYLARHAQGPVLILPRAARREQDSSSEETAEQTAVPARTGGTSQRPVSV